MSERSAPKRTRPAMGAGLSGLVTVALLFGSQLLMQSGGTAEPSFTAAASEIERYFQTRNDDLYATGSYVQVLGLLALAWFVGGVYVILRSAGNAHSWLPAVALVSGGVAVAAILGSGGELATERVDEGLDPEIARLVFDMGSLGFANIWVALGSFALATGCAILATRSAPAWLAWWAVIAGLAMITVRAVWTTPLWLVAYALFWLWVTVVSIRFITGRTPVVASER
jgi:hypothetical protein